MPFKHYGSNSNKYESRHLLPGRAIASGDEEDNRDHQPSSESSFRERLSSASPLRKAFFARVLVLGVFAVSAGTGRYLVTSRNRVHASDSSGIAAREGTLAKQESSMVTSECTPPSLPVLEGADMVSYFSLEEGDGAVFGDEQYESVYNGYRFWFQSEENQALFEVNHKSYRMLASRSEASSCGKIHYFARYFSANSRITSKNVLTSARDRVMYWRVLSKDHAFQMRDAVV